MTNVIYLKITYRCSKCNTLVSGRFYNNQLNPIQSDNKIIHNIKCKICDTNNDVVVFEF